ncbi:MAG TPA: hypothetical protein VGG28_23700, partial [Kofleriaceae bacterium]
FIHWIQIGDVPRFPTAILSASIMLLAFLSLAVGFNLDTVTHGRRELKRLMYLQVPGTLSTNETSAAQVLDIANPRGDGLKRTS